MIAKFHVAKDRYIFGREGSSVYNRVYGSVRILLRILIHNLCIFVFIRNVVVVAQLLPNPEVCTYVMYVGMYVSYCLRTY